jgi:hypothetical protein
MSKCIANNYLGLRQTIVILKSKAAEVPFSLNESSLSKTDESSYDGSTYDDSLNADGDWLPISDILVDSRSVSGTVDSVLSRSIPLVKSGTGKKATSSIIPQNRLKSSSLLQRGTKPSCYIYDNYQNAENRMLVSYSPYYLERLANAQTFFMDGTFSVAPYPCKQLYTIRVSFKDVTVTAVFHHTTEPSEVVVVVAERHQAKLLYLSP